MGRNLRTFIKLNYKRAIAFRHIQAFYQPVIRTSSRQLCSFEALARWIDPELGMIYPNEFIPVLEEEGLIHELDMAILRQACARIRRSVAAGETPIPVSVNLSRLDFTLCDVFEAADAIVSDYQIPHSFIYFEITESVMAEDKDLLTGIVDRFRSAGYQIWMDDFGSAYSSLNVLKEFEFDELKLDMGFLRPFNTRSKRIATAVIKMAKDIEIHTLVEGVETEEQFAYLRDVGCEKVQGYYFGKPMRYEDALEHLQAQGIDIEVPHDRKYYDTIGQIDLLSAVPFMTQQEHDAITTARQLNSIPLSIVEFSATHFKVLFYNTAFEVTANGTGAFFDIFTQEMLCKPRPNELISPRLNNLIDSVRAGGDGRMLFTINEHFYEIKVRNMARASDRFCALFQITNLTKDTQAQNTASLDEYARRIYALYERITLIDMEDDSIRPLYTDTRDDLVSKRSDVRALLEEFAQAYVYPDDRETYLRLFDPDDVAEHLAASSSSSLSALLRSSVRHGQYGWKEYTLLKIDQSTYLSLIRDVNDSVSEAFRQNVVSADAAGPFSPAQLWTDLINTDLLRIFWKDTDRRFLGASKSFLDYYGFLSDAEIIGKNDEDLGWHVHPDLYKSDEYQVIHEGATFHNMPGRCMKDGENREILASKTPLYDINGKIKGLMGYFIDRELLSANDKRGQEVPRRDMLTGLLNSRGISEEASFFRDEYYLRDTDFVRIHITINDFSALNEQYGYDHGDKILNALGKALKLDFGLTSAVGRTSGQKFVVLHQVEDQQEAHDLRMRIKSIGESIKHVDDIPLTLYLSVGYALFSEVTDLGEQKKLCDIRLHADYDQNISAESRLAHSSEIFRLFDDLPISYSVYHVTHSESNGQYDAVIFYANHAFEQLVGYQTKQILGHSVREVFPCTDETWFDNLKRAAWDAETVEEDFFDASTGRTFHLCARQIIYPGYCAMTCMEV